jgi:hypothetical protein
MRRNAVATGFGTAACIWFLQTVPDNLTTLGNSTASEARWVLLLAALCLGVMFCFDVVYEHGRKEES